MKYLTQVIRPQESQGGPDPDNPPPGSIHGVEQGSHVFFNMVERTNYSLI